MGADGAIRQLVTVGHGTLGADEFAALLGAAGIEVLVDVRTAPGSRRVPHFGRSELEGWLPAHGIAYEWHRELGGFRRAHPDSRHTSLRNASFRGYADYMDEPEFVAALDRLMAMLERRSAIMCSESLWWRCHRRLIADAAVLLRGVRVEHLLHDGRLTPHQPTEGVRVDGGRLTYDA